MLRKLADFVREKYHLSPNVNISPEVDDIQVLVPLALEKVTEINDLQVKWAAEQSDTIEEFLSLIERTVK
jgi:hypothetical protein